MKKIPLSPSKYGQFYAIVDDEDFDELSKYTWHVHNNSGRGFYVKRCFNDPKNWRKVKNAVMHRQILNFPKNPIDHINKKELYGEFYNG